MTGLLKLVRAGVRPNATLPNSVFAKQLHKCLVHQGYYIVQATSKVAENF